MNFLKRFMSWFKREPDTPAAAPVAAEAPVPPEPPKKATAVRASFQPIVDPKVKNALEEIDLSPSGIRARPPARKEAISMLARDAVFCRHKIVPRQSSITMHGLFASFGRVTRVTAFFKYVDYPDGKFAAALDRKEEARLADLGRVLRRHFN